MNKATMRFRYYRLACKVGSRFSSWYSLLGRSLHSPKERMNFIYIPIEKSVEEPERRFLPIDIFDRLIDAAKGTAIIHKCMCRVGGHCENYPHDIGCIALGAVDDLDPMIGRVVSKEEAKAHARKGLDAKLYPLVSHYERDAMMFSLDLEHISLVCFCCPCHCVPRRAGKEGDEKPGSFYDNGNRFPGVQVTFDESKCVGCKKCIEPCIANAISFENGRIVFDSERCKGCGHCAYICDAFAVTVDNGDVDAAIAQTGILKYIS